jgi:hypothetical protein
MAVWADLFRCYDQSTRAHGEALFDELIRRGSVEPAFARC